MSLKVIISVSNDIVCDQRLIRMADVLVGKGYKLTIVGRELKDSLPVRASAYNVHRFRMIFRRGFLFYKFLNIRLLFYLLSHRPDLLIAIDLDTLLPNVIVSRFKSIPLIYDAHEYFMGVPELRDRPLVRSVWKTIEKYCFRYVKEMLTVNDSIADLYRADYGIRPVVLRNIGIKPDLEISDREILGIAVDELLVVIQGTGINKERGGLEAIKSIERINSAPESDLPMGTYKSIHLLVIGSGDELPAMRNYVYDNNLFDEVTFLAPMEWKDMMSYTMMADIGLSLDKPLSINYINSLPNKIFDYINAGIAIVATGLPEVEKVVAGAGCGLIITDSTVESIYSALETLFNDNSLLQGFKTKSRKASLNYSWDNEKKILEEVIRLTQ